MNVIIIRGPLGVGKSTVAKLIAKRLGGEYISVDKVLDEHGLDKTVEGEGIPLSNFLKANEFIQNHARNAEGRQTVVIDGNFYYREQLDDLVSSFNEAVTVFTLKASVDTCIARDAARAKSYGEDATRAVHMFVTAFDYGTVIDTDSQTVEETIRTMLDQLEQ